MLKRDPPLAEALLKHPNFARDAHLTLAASLGTNYYSAAARLFFDAAKRNPKFAWSGPLMDMLATLPSEEVRPLFRRQWANLALRDELVLKLAPKPDALDRDKFISGLASMQSPVARASLTALLELPRDPAGKELLPAIHLLRRTLNEPKEDFLRTNLVTLVNSIGGQKFKIEESGTDAESLKRAYAPVFAWIAQKYPALARTLVKEEEPDAAKWNLVLKSVAWDKGHAARGQTIFEQRGCQTCHAATTALGPDLGGVTGRLSVNDLFGAINFPSRDVAAPYRTTVFQMRDGQTHTGIVAFDSADGVMLQTGATTTIRLANADIVSRRPSSISLMPTGLLVGLKPSDLADLYSYLKTLQPKN
jgi:putative heme-binding domain-containing protein